MTIVRGVWNHHSYTVGHATTKCWKSSIEFFLSSLKFLSCFFSTLHCLHHFRRFSSLAIYIWVYVLYSIHLLLFLQVVFSAKWMWSDPSPLYAKLNPIYSQILHVHSTWNSFKIFTVSLSAEEFVNETFNLSYLTFQLCRSNRSASHENTYLFTHDLTRSPPLSTWVTHVKRMRRVRGTFVLNLRANSFSLRL